MDLQRIAALLQPFLASPVPKESSCRAGFSPEGSAFLSDVQLQQISTYLDLLLRWNARINLTAVREPDEIVPRHFGESLFAARYLFPSEECAERSSSAPPRLFDFGSGAGFPGLPMKIWAPGVELTLIESNQKKATFLREVIRRLLLNSAAVFCGRAQNFNGQAEVVTLRAVERFESSVPVAAGLVAPEGRFALLIGQAQMTQARELLPPFHWQEPIPIPLSSNRVLLIGHTCPVGDESN